MSNFDRDVIIKKLQRKGLRIKYCQGSHTISYFEAPAHVSVGIKCLGYLDFLKVNVVKKPIRDRKKDKQKTINTMPSKAWSFNWFNNREDGENWAKKQKLNKWLDIEIFKASVFQTENMSYRACLEGTIK